MKRRIRINSISLLTRLVLCAFVAATVSYVSRGSSATLDSQSADQLKGDLSRLRDIQPQSQIHSEGQREEVKTIVNRLKNGNPQQVTDGIVDALRNRKLNREVPAYRQVLPELPALKPEMLRRITAESDPGLKGALINCMLNVRGADVIRALIQQLDDKRPAAVNPGPSALRVCDTAYNVIYNRVAHIEDLGLDHSSAMSDAISPGVPVEWRDARIAKLKVALLTKFGPELNLPDQL